MQVIDQDRNSSTPPNIGRKRQWSAIAGVTADALASSWRHIQKRPVEAGSSAAASPGANSMKPTSGERSVANSRPRARSDGSVPDGVYRNVRPMMTRMSGWREVRALGD
jgi:hypothetical protein